jgi:Glycosyltransferase 61
MSDLSSEILEDITVGPLLPGSGKMSLIFVVPPAARVHFEHRRSRHSRIAHISKFSDEQQTIAAQDVPGTVVYGGPLFAHFGHFLAESLHRLWPVFADPALAQARIAFHSFTFGRPPVSMAPWMVDVLAYLNIDASRCIMIDRPMRFEKLVVATQGSVLGQGPCSPRYLDLFPPRLCLANLPHGREMRSLYVSRSRHAYSGSYLGEELIESVLAEQAGFDVVYPEDHRVVDLIAMFVAAPVIVFSEGSAMHVLELCGRLEASIFVICRRDASSVSEAFFGCLLRQLARRVEFFGGGTALIPLDWEPTRSQPAWQNASAMLDLALLIERLAAFIGKELKTPTRDEVASSCRQSLSRIMSDPRSTRRSTTPEQLAMLQQQLKAQAASLGLL